MFGIKKKQISPEIHEIQWTPQEIEDWLSLDDRRLEADIEFPGLEPMNPFEIRAKYLEDILFDVVCEAPSILYSQAIDVLIRILVKKLLIMD